MDDNYRVYIKVDSNNSIVAVNSSTFLSDTEGWVEIDEGIGDKYHHAQGNYLPKGLVDENGSYNYKYSGGTVIEITIEEKQVKLAMIQNNNEVSVLKAQIADTDYKIIKCSEYQLAGLEMPYDIQTLHTERQTLRDRINELELTLV